ncbi:hypothetical protein BPLS_P2218 [Bathymodiolus platifrons methanotrophic gill symbiont]|uniref:hypothetical protein n=1 Tax=Bathymodiolus platifrons methanotrophic gill symbiont TaxID=113268 RepID=UPI001B787916|nr:hypothetical protein [Bathymodiolus platifrons methanotrophic gill symbiont]GFO75170.1 hypothetical protein BPLS_P2218 [Bathymodiolus platifrons methanotrophic gill symbiont]
MKTNKTLFTPLLLLMAITFTNPAFSETDAGTSGEGQAEQPATGEGEDEQPATGEGEGDEPATEPTKPNTIYGDGPGYYWSYTCRDSDIRATYIYLANTSSIEQARDRASNKENTAKCDLVVFVKDTEVHKNGWDSKDEDLLNLLKNLSEFTHWIDAPIYFEAIKTASTNVVHTLEHTIDNLKDDEYNLLAVRLHYFGYEDGWRAGVHDDWTWTRGYRGAWYKRGASRAGIDYQWGPIY